MKGILEINFLEYEILWRELFLMLFIVIQNSLKILYTHAQEVLECRAVISEKKKRGRVDRRMPLFFVFYFLQSFDLG